jgi:hypothetical protein
MWKNFKALFFGLLAVFFFALTACGGGSGSGGSGTCNWTPRTSGTTTFSMALLLEITPLWQLD